MGRGGRPIACQKRERKGRERNVVELVEAKDSERLVVLSTSSLMDSLETVDEERQERNNTTAS
jgi:hypothetical protein